MPEESHRLNLTLDAERADRLKRLAERTHLQEGTRPLAAVGGH
jgi:hypothetical protein